MSDDAREQALAAATEAIDLGANRLAARGGLAMPGKLTPPCADARRRFADRNKRLKNLWLASPDVLARLCSDERMQCVWNLTADLPDDQFFALMVALVSAKRECEAAVEFWKSCGESGQVVNEAQAALEHLMSVLQRRNGNWDLWQTGHDQTVEGDYLRWVQADLARQHTEIHKTMADLVETRKTASAARTMFMADAVRLTRKVLGKPHYDAVAAFTAVAFDEDDVDPAAVRAAFRKSGGSKVGEWLFERLK